MDSSAEMTRSTTSIPAAPASMLPTKRSCPGTSTNPNRTPCSSRNAKPRSMVMPRRFSSASRSGWVPVSASTSADLPWSMCPAVPTITLLVPAMGVAVVMFGWENARRLGCYWRKESAVKRKGLLRGGDFVDDGLRGPARIGCCKNRAADHEKVRAGANGLLGRRFARLIVGLRLHIGFLRAHAGSDDQKPVAAHFANGFRLLNRSDHAVHSRLLCKRCEFHDARLRRSADANFFHRLVVHAGENGDGQQARPVCAHWYPSAHGLRCGFHHGFAAERVHVHQ